MSEGDGDEKFITFVRIAGLVAGYLVMKGVLDGCAACLVLGIAIVVTATTAILYYYRRGG